MTTYTLLKNGVAILSVAVASACGGGGGGGGPDVPIPTTYQLSVVVRDTAGHFVHEATVSTGGQTLTTNAFGFAQTTLTPGTYTVAVQKAGYETPPDLVINLSRHLHRDIRLVPRPPPTSRLRIDGRFFINDAGTYRGRWTSGLTLLARSRDERSAFLDWAVSTGFDGVRVFAGNLPWAGQTPASALAALPDLILETQARGLYLYVVAITESAAGFDVEDHLRQVAQLCAAGPHCVLEVANEIGHSTQSSTVNDPRRLEAIARRVVPSSVTWSLGAMLGLDEPNADGVYPANGAAPFNTAHLDRGRDKWNQVRRVREIAGISEITNKPAISGEPIGAAEQPQPGRRESDPHFFFAYGALCRMFELGACVFHSEDGLQARLPGPVQQQCAEAFVEGVRSIDTTARLGYRNAGWSGGDVPVASFTNAVRVYAGVTGSEGYVVVVGDQGVQVEWKNGYRVVADVARRPGVIVWKIQR